MKGTSYSYPEECLLLLPLLAESLLQGDNLLLLSVLNGLYGSTICAARTYCKHERRTGFQLLASSSSTPPFLRNSAAA